MNDRSQFLKGCARTAVLQLLSERPMYGYEIAAALSARSQGIFALGQGTLYPLLYSLQAKGLIGVARDEASPDGRLRRYYKLTPAGRERLAGDRTTWQDIARGMRLVLGGASA